MYYDESVEALSTHFSLLGEHRPDDTEILRCTKYHMMQQLPSPICCQKATKGVQTLSYLKNACSGLVRGDQNETNVHLILRYV